MEEVVLDVAEIVALEFKRCAFWHSTEADKAAAIAKLIHQAKVSRLDINAGTRVITVYAQCLLIEQARDVREACAAILGDS